MCDEERIWFSRAISFPEMIDAEQVILPRIGASAPDQYGAWSQDADGEDQPRSRGGNKLL
jgi:hypothetical protein